MVLSITALLLALVGGLFGAALQHHVSYRRGLRAGEDVGWRKARNQMRAIAQDHHRQVDADDVPPPLPGTRLIQRMPGRVVARH